MGPMPIPWGVGPLPDMGPPRAIVPPLPPIPLERDKPAQNLERRALRTPYPSRSPRAHGLLPCKHSSGTFLKALTRKNKSNCKKKVSHHKDRVNESTDEKMIPTDHQEDSALERPLDEGQNDDSKLVVGLEKSSYRWASVPSRPRCPPPVVV